MTRPTDTLSLGAWLRSLLTDEPQPARRLVDVLGVDQRRVASVLVQGLQEGWVSRPRRGEYARGPQWAEADESLILGWLGRYGPQTLARLQDQLPLRPERLHEVLVALERAGLIERRGDDVWAALSRM